MNLLCHPHLNDEANPAQVRILIGDDDRALAATMSTFVEHCGHRVVATITSGGLDVLYAYDRYQPDVVVMDVMMPRFNGFTICHAILSKRPDAKIILMSGRLSADHPFVLNSGACRFLRKPMRLARLREAIEEISGSAAAVAA
jgi:DNA-binding response OmpR family regulator